jgi:hypothetical protein
MAEKHEGSMTLTKEDLAAIVTAAIAAAKAPNVVEQAELDARKREIAEAQSLRLQTSEEQKKEVANKKWIHHNCTHEHKNGDTHCVWVQEKSGPGYLICQKNQCIIRPGAVPSDYKGTQVFDTALFNRIFQKLPGGEIFS